MFDTEKNARRAALLAFPLISCGYILSAISLPFKFSDNYYYRHEVGHDLIISGTSALGAGLALLLLAVLLFHKYEQSANSNVEENKASIAPTPTSPLQPKRQ